MSNRATGERFVSSSLELPMAAAPARGKRVIAGDLMVKYPTRLNPPEDWSRQLLTEGAGVELAARQQSKRERP
jgi:hypothetical protein